MRRAVFSISLAYAILFGWLWYDTATGSMDAAGRGMALGFLTIAIGTTGIFIVPALILAINNRALKVALILSLVPAGLMLFAMASNVI